MALLTRRPAPRALASAPMVLRPLGGGRRRAASGVLAIAAALLAGAGGYHLLLTRALDGSAEPSVPMHQLRQLQQQLDEARLQQRVSEGRGRELEHQIDALNKQLRESQDELTFFRKARDGKS